MKSSSLSLGFEFDSNISNDLTFDIFQIFNQNNNLFFGEEDQHYSKCKELYKNIILKLNTEKTDRLKSEKVNEIIINLNNTKEEHSIFKNNSTSLINEQFTKLSFNNKKFLIEEATDNPIYKSCDNFNIRGDGFF